MIIFLVITRNGTFVTSGNTEHEAKINFTINFPNEKIRKIKQLDSKAIQVSYSELDLNNFE